eukprot:m.178058 g.178058  ORF g.178058 m.178058 type:complete len:255 (-) comp18385_c0_seq5:8353-9117(-)
MVKRASATKSVVTKGRSKSDKDVTTKESGFLRVGILAVAVVVAAVLYGKLHGSPKPEEQGGAPIDVAERRSDRSDEQLESDDPTCVDTSDNCAAWAQSGECDRNPGYMHVNCARSCSMCTGKDGTGIAKVKRDYELRCQRDSSLTPVLHAGDGNTSLDALFERILENDEVKAKYSPNVISRDPWVVTLDNFVTTAEMEQLLTVLEGKFERSTGAGAVNANGAFARTVTDVSIFTEVTRSVTPRRPSRHRCIRWV